MGKTNGVLRGKPTVDIDFICQSLIITSLLSDQIKNLANFQGKGNWMPLNLFTRCTAEKYANALRSLSQ